MSRSNQKAFPSNEQLALLFYEYYTDIHEFSAAIRGKIMKAEKVNAKEADYRYKVYELKAFNKGPGNMHALHNELLKCDTIEEYFKILNKYGVKEENK